MPKKIGRRFGQNSGAEGQNDQSRDTDQDVLLRLKNMAQEILNLQTTIATKQSQDESADGLDNMASSSPSQLQSMSTKEGRIIRRSSAKLQESPPVESIEQKLQQLSELRYELSNELEVSLQNLQKVMQKSQNIVSEMSELLKQQGKSNPT